MDNKKIVKTGLCSLVVFCLLFTIPSSSQSLSTKYGGDTHEKPDDLTYTVVFSHDDFLFSTMWGYDRIELKDGACTMDVGKPMVPVKYLRIAIPDDMNVKDLELREFTQEQFTGRYTLLPSQVVLPTRVAFDETMFIKPDEAVYSSTDPYPDTFIELLGHCDLAGQGMVAIAVYPIIYTPAEKTVTLISSVTFSISGTDDYICGDYLSPTLSQQNKDMYQQLVQGMVINPDYVVLRQSVSPQSCGVLPGDYEYVIITQESWVSAFQPLADWKTQKGVPATIVTTSWIYNNGGYSGTNLEKIKAFIQDANSNWGTVFFLLGGDTDVVPANYRTFSSVDPEPVANDAYYADYDNDWVCEVHVGRASVTGPGTGTGQIGTFINKILSYEKNPPLTNFAKKAGFFGFDLDSSTYTEQLMTTIRNTYVPGSWTMKNVYDSHGGDHKTEVIGAIDAGQNLMNHADHCNSNYMGTGYVNHNWGLSNSDMIALANSNRYGIFYSLGCWPAAYDEPACIAEYFVRNNNGGGVAFIGNSRFGYYNSGTYNTLSMKYDAYFFKSLFPENNYKLGVCFSDHKNDAYQWDLWGYYKYLFTELTLLGDPEMPIWTENPLSMTASFPSQIPVAPASFTVSVSSAGSAVPQAYVCLWKGTEIYFAGLTNSAGQITFSINPTSSGRLQVTVTKQNYLPFEGIALVGNSPPDTPQRPSGPTSGKINVEYTFSTSTTDPNGDSIFYMWSWGDGIQSNWLGPYTSGASVSATHMWSEQGTFSITVKAKDSAGEESDWSEPFAVSMPLDQDQYLGHSLHSLWLHARFLRYLSSIQLTGAKH